MDNLKERVKYELDGEEGSFIFDLRCNLKWDHNKLVDVLNNFYKYILSIERTEFLERSISYGFWFFENFVKSWSEHEGFRSANRYSEKYYIQAYEVIYFLVEWYFGYECPFISHESFLDEIGLLNDYVRE